MCENYNRLLLFEMLVPADTEASATAGKVYFPDPWLLHAAIHVFHQAKKWDEGIAHLEKNLPAYSLDNLHIFLYTHFYWHLAVTYIERAKSLAALTAAQRIFETRLWDCFWAAASGPAAGGDSGAKQEGKNPEALADPQVQLNALGLLWRIEELLGLLRAGTEEAATGPGGPAFEADAKAFLAREDTQKYVRTKFDQIHTVFVERVDPLLDVLFCRFLEEPQRREFVQRMREFARGKRAELAQAAELAGCVDELLTAVGDEKRRTELRAKLRAMDRNCLGNSWEQRAVLDVL